MAPTPILQRRAHNLLLFQKLLNLRDGASPFTLILDSLEQSAQPVITEFMSRATNSKTKIVFVSFTTIRQPKLADVKIKARGKSLAALREEIVTSIPKPQTGSISPHSSNKAPSHLNSESSNKFPETLIVIDSLQPLCTNHSTELAAFLSSLLGPTASIIAVYHFDIPLSFCSHQRTNEYAPDPLLLLTYLATAILKVRSLAHTVEKKMARDRSMPEPEFGLKEDREGVIFGLDRAKLLGIGEGEGSGVVIEMEVRRRSGRGVKEMFVLFTEDKISKTAGSIPKTKSGSMICLLDDHDLFAPPVIGRTNVGEAAEEGAGDITFNLGLTEKQRRDRDGIVPPYFDAQSGEELGEGGRILYDMDRGDDFDEEEDEI